VVFVAPVIDTIAGERQGGRVLVTNNTDIVGIVPLSGRKPEEKNRAAEEGRSDLRPTPPTSKQGAQKVSFSFHNISL
jgi:hypothetical protein